jgi:hypothetical protein
MYTLGTVYILFETLFVYVKMRDLFEVAELGGTLCIIGNGKGGSRITVIIINVV